MTGKEAQQPKEASAETTADVELMAVLAAVTGGQPRVMTIRDATALPSGPFEIGHRSLQSGLRTWVERQTGHPLGYVEQLYTFADSDRTSSDRTRRAISISYLGLTRESAAGKTAVMEHADASWRSWYDYFPWEDRRTGTSPLLDTLIRPGLQRWSCAEGAGSLQAARWQRAALNFGFDDHGWNDELVLQRYELLYEAGMIAESDRTMPGEEKPSGLGKPMSADHRRILATGIARLRAKIKYRPIVFELMAPSFTLLQLQRSVEALAGGLVHKPNFRRLIEQQHLVEETGETTLDTGGRPAKLFRFRSDIREERAAAGTKPPIYTDGARR